VRNTQKGARSLAGQALAGQADCSAVKIEAGLSLPNNPDI
jgi:hypothetical protein